MLKDELYSRITRADMDSKNIIDPTPRWCCKKKEENVTSKDLPL
jgi:hypothetical protein